LRPSLGKNHAMEARIVWIKQHFEAATAGLVAALADRGVTPTQVSLAGLAVTIASAPLIASGWLTVGALVFGFGSLADAIDGALARRLGVVSDFGAFLDSTLDRVGEAAGLAGLAAYFVAQGEVWAVVLVVVALAAGNLTSYVRARAESLGVACSDGWMSRTERVFVFGLGLLLHLPEIMIVVLATATSVTAAQRFVVVRRALTERVVDAEEGSGPGQTPFGV
jgi:CDP-diacylglycerol--glycerol-3-phosphate 3-phosphatidyltransferase